MPATERGLGSPLISMRAFHRAGVVALAYGFLVLPALTQGAASAQGGAVADTARHVTVGAFIDTYYAYDFNRPPNIDRQYTTQPSRHNEANVNLAFVEATLATPRTHGRIALQAGTSVQSNYAAEPRVGAVSGPDLSRLIQEAFVGYRLAPTVWIDGGIFFSHLGMESWISRDNPTYSRSLVSDYSPYYQSGGRLLWQATPALSMQLDVVNGWQNISENNSGKAGGIRVDYAPTAATTLSYYNFVGDEAPDSVQTADGSRLRVFQGIGAKLAPTRRLSFLLELDGGRQRRGHLAGDGWSSWYGYAATARYAVTPSVAVSGRSERFDDPDQVLVATGVNSGFRANGLSLGIDVTPDAKLFWRTEVRGYGATDRVFTKRTGIAKGDGFVVTSLSLTI